MTLPKPEAKIGMWTAAALVVGNMIASGIFLLPVALASYGSISFVGWVGSSLGAIALALMFGRLSRYVPGATGGPYAFTRATMGEFAGFLVAWGYWLSIWCCNAAIVVTFVSYLTVFFPVLADDVYLALAAALGTIWFLTWINSLGVRSAGRVQLLTTILKLTPLIIVSVAGLFFIEASHFTPFNASSQSNGAAITSTITLTLFAFLGLESATVPSGHIRDPRRTIPRATVIGTLVTMAVYILGSIAVMGVVPPDQLRSSNAPFSDAAAIIWGDQARGWVALGAIASTFGALNGWILLQGQVPLAASRDGLFPAVFGKLNGKGTPGIGMVIGSLLISGLIVMNFTKGLNSMFTFAVLLGTVTVLLPYLFSAAAFALLVIEQGYTAAKATSLLLLAALAFGYSMWAVIGSGHEAVFWGFIAILTGLPFYVWMRRLRKPSGAIANTP